MNPYLKLAIALAIYVAVGHKILRKAFRNIKNGQIFDENFLMVVATFGSLAMGEYEEAIMVMVLYRIGEYFQDKAVAKSRRSIADLMDIRPDYANIEGENGELQQVDPEDVEVGTVITIKPGERVPVDGVVVEGESRLDTAALTGESMPRSVEEGDEVFSGTINLNGLLKVKVTKPCSESTATRILELVEEAADNKGKAEKFITRFARYYTPIVCGLALAVALIPSLVTGDWAVWVHRALIFLVVSCPCALVISVPLSFFAGIGGASSKGVLIKGGNYLEALSKADTVVFDKTGTLTKGVFSVVAVHPEGITEEELLELAAIAESFSDHPISKSLADEYKRRTRKRVDKGRVESFEEFAGEGVVTIVDGRKLQCGNRRLMERVGVKWHECHLHGTTVHIAIDGRYEGHIVIADVEKDDAKDAIKALKNQGVARTVMLTGDKQDIASDVAADLGLDKYYAEMMPEDKVHKVEELIATKGEGKTVAFVGDGINDAPVLSRSDVGIAMGSMGSAAAVEAADIVLMNDKPSDVALAIRIAKKTMRIIYENIWFSIGIKVLVLILAAFGIANMWLAIFADVGVCMLAILNAMRALRIR
ncbi:MAG: cadmium-translocating P-type ATPase [Firmicutes bacterium]|nr:cadmium-translocating P-type ATPase [Bacillota bacterium]MBR6969677.1 cadmium-translocating P-type ATPase [Bacillota bacterium]